MKSDPPIFFVSGRFWRLPFLLLKAGKSSLWATDFLPYPLSRDFLIILMLAASSLMLFPFPPLALQAGLFTTPGKNRLGQGRYLRDARSPENGHFFIRARFAAASSFRFAGLTFG
jgi:hypothetical protein